LVDASFLALALVRCPWLWENLDAEAKKNLETALVATRQTIPVYSNWILFSGMIEAFLAKYGLNYDPVRIEYGIRQFSGPWYAGDGMFNDGNDFHMDYYNSYVIQPYLTNILDATAVRTKSFGWFTPRMDQIAQRYAVIQERMINTDGTFPVVGRSIVYRGGAFHHLADMALREKLPASLKPAQVRGALTAVIDKTLGAPNSFTDAMDGSPSGCMANNPNWPISTSIQVVCISVQQYSCPWACLNPMIFGRPPMNHGHR
jgi:hypothetical protein